MSQPRPLVSPLPNQSGLGTPADFTIPFQNNLLDANVLITGGASGIGKACAIAFLKHGSYITIADLNTTSLDEAKNELDSINQGHVQCIQCDVTDWQSQVKLFVAAAQHGIKKGVIDIVIPCAGVRGQPFNFTKPSDLSDISIPPTPCIAIALQGQYYTCQLGSWYMDHPESSKCMIMIGSMSAYSPIPAACDYVGAKHGVRGMFKAMRDANSVIGLGEKSNGIRVNYLAPGFVRTPLTEIYVSILIKQGIRLVPMENVVDAVLRIAADPSIIGRAIGVGPDDIFDLKDDNTGLNGLLQMKDRAWYQKPN